MTDGAFGTPHPIEEGKTLTESIVNDQAGSDPQQEPPRLGDKVVYDGLGEDRHPAWTDRRTHVGIVVGEAQDAGYYNVVYDPAAAETWRAKSNAIRVVERATYTPVGE